MKRLVTALVFTILVLVPTVLVAQEEDDGWDIASELGASVFFGASEQTAVLLRNTAAKKTNRVEISGLVAFDYGEAQSEGGPAVVNKRSWQSGLEVDYEFGKWAPFVFVNGEGSFERQIDVRLWGGAGTRYRFIQNAVTKLNFSAAIQAERTDPRAVAEQADEVVTLARWSTRLRLNRQLMDGRTVYELVSWYRAAFDDQDDYTVDLETSLTFALNGTVSFKTSLVNRYDSLAEDRGAVSNNDGRLFFSVVAKH